MINTQLQTDAPITRLIHRVKVCVYCMYLRNPNAKTYDPETTACVVGEDGKKSSYQYGESC